MIRLKNEDIMEIQHRTNQTSPSKWKKNMELAVVGKSGEVNCVEFTNQQHPDRLILARIFWYGFQLLSHLSVCHT